MIDSCVSEAQSTDLGMGLGWHGHVLMSVSAARCRGHGHEYMSVPPRPIVFMQPFPDRERG